MSCCCRVGGTTVATSIDVPDSGCGWRHPPDFDVTPDAHPPFYAVPRLIILRKGTPDAVRVDEDVASEGISE